MFCLFQKTAKRDFWDKILFKKQLLNDYSNRIVFFMSLLEKDALDNRSKNSLINYLRSYAKTYRQIYQDDELLKNNFMSAVHKTHNEYQTCQANLTRGSRR